ncbi:M28 family metallopeptidase [Haloarcula halophila]|uniref:M28 family metallopeptidase n=1 Tax=Haloarcula TaxID=2237 RepID=UPI0023E44313|nr:M28 family metallopeptidase [Halomicroarcula sp. DFY41]
MTDTAWIGETITSDVGWSHLERLVDIGNRMAGSDGERAAAEATRDALAEYAETVRLEPFDIQGWERGDSGVSADGEPVATADHEVIALPRSPAGDASGELIDLGYGLPEEFEQTDCAGKIVMVRSDVPDWYDRFIHRREKYYRAVDAGAAGFVYRNHVEGMVPPTGSVGTQTDPLGAIPAVGVARETGARLSRRYDGEPVAVSVDCETPAATSRNVHAELGPETEGTVLVTSHVDAHDIAEGALDNGAGTAMLVEVARALAAREGELDRRVEFVAFGAEEVGLVGSERLAAKRDLDTVDAVLNFDGVVRERTLEFHTHDFAAIKEAVDEVSDRLDHATATTPRQGPHSDHWPFVQWGVPGCHVMSETADAGRGWAHTHADTLEKLDVRTLREQAVVLTELAVAFASEGFEPSHRDPKEVARRLEAEGKATGMRLTGDWPYDD